MWSEETLLDEGQEQTNPLTAKSSDKTVMLYWLLQEFRYNSTKILEQHIAMQTWQAKYGGWQTDIIKYNRINAVVVWTKITTNTIATLCNTKM